MKQIVSGLWTLCETATPSINETNDDIADAENFMHIRAKLVLIWHALSFKRFQLCVSFGKRKQSKNRVMSPEILQLKKCYMLWLDGRKSNEFEYLQLRSFSNAGQLYG